MTFQELWAIPFVVGVVSGIVVTIATPYAQHYLAKVFLSASRQAAIKYNLPQVVYVKKLPFRPTFSHRMDRRTALWHRKYPWFADIYIKWVMRFAIAIFALCPIIALAAGIALRFDPPPAGPPTGWDILGYVFNSLFLGCGLMVGFALIFIMPVVLLIVVYMQALVVIRKVQSANRSLPSLMQKLADPREG